MPNGGDANWIRLCAALEGFYLRYGRWPSRVRLRPGVLADLREHIFNPTEFARLEARLTFVVDDRSAFLAEDDTPAAYEYGRDGFPSGHLAIRADEWLGDPAVNPDAG